MKERVVYFDYLRVFATFAVVLLHTAAQNWGNVATSSFEWQVFNVFDSAVRWAVPIFVMISGALFLDRQISIKSLFTKNILRLLTAYLVWGAVYAIVDGGGIKNIFVKTFWGHYHMWFIPMIIGLYICLPILQKIAESEKIAKYFLLLSFIFTYLLPWIMQIAICLGGKRFELINNIYKEFYGNMSLSLVSGFSGYFILGYILKKYEISKVARRIIYALGIVGFLSTVILCLISSVKLQENNEFFYGNLTVNVLLESIAVFVWFKYHSPKSERIGLIASKLSKYSFGVYLIHVLLIDLLKNQFGFNTLSINPILAVPCIATVVFLVSLAISWFLNKIPLLNKYIV